MTNRFNLIKRFDDIQNEREDRNAEYHKHVDDEVGASNLNGCIAKRTKEVIVKEPPKLTGMRLNKGGMRTGSEIHEWLQRDLIESYLRYPEPGVYIGDEVYVRVGLDGGVYVLSPIDIAFADKPFIKERIKFKNVIKPVNVLAPGATFLEIYDIKSGGDYGYFDKYMNGIPIDHKLQFHIYMKGAKLKVIYVLNFHKQYAYKKIDECVWEDEVWEHINKGQERVEKLIKTFNETEEVKFKREDFKCFNEKSIDWYSCPYAFTKEEILPNGKPHLVLDKPCLEMQKLIIGEAKAKFTVGTKWKRGNSHITILSIDGENILSENKGKKDKRKEFIDNFYYAYQKYKVLEVKKK